MNGNMTDRDRYPNLPADVSIHHCTKDAPMNIDGDKAEELKQLWIHDDANEVDEDEYYSERFIYMHCPNCDYKYFCDLGD